jgi:hypothetical protein
MAILKEMNARPLPDRLEQAIYVGGTEAPREEYARFEKIAIDASRVSVTNAVQTIIAALEEEGYLA